MNKTPDNIAELSMKEVYELITPTKPPIPALDRRIAVLQILYDDIFKYDLTPDSMLALASEPKAQLILATAGAGKTTAVQTKIVLEKILRGIKGRKVLCLVYNKHNVEQMTRTHEKLVSMVKRSAPDMSIDDEITAHTMHSFCRKWFIEYNYLTEYAGSTFMEPFDVNKSFEDILSVVCMKYKKEPKKAAAADIASVYTILKETLSSYDECDTIDNFNTIGYPKELVIEVMELYDKGKKRKNKYDYTDMLYGLLTVLQTQDMPRNYIQKRYDFIVADEVQDMTPIMMEILKLIKRDDAHLVCIGDEDQNIYNFRGASIKTILNFEKTFEGAEVFTLATNRRCGSNIVALAWDVINQNEFRYDKSMRSVREGGNIEFRPYQTLEEQLDSIINELKCMSIEELNSTCICYRNRRSSLLLSCLLEKETIPFHVLSGYQPYEHEVYRNFLSVLKILKYPMDREDVMNIYKVIPGLTRKRCNAMVGFNGRTFKSDAPRKHFYDLDYGVVGKSKQNQGILEYMKYISDHIDTLPMKEYIPELFKIFRKVWWDKKMKYNNTLDEDMMFTEQAYEFFNVDVSFSAFYDDYLLRLRKCQINNQQNMGVALSTFHSLKGLEYKNVYIIDLNDSIFPNFDKIDNDERYSAVGKQELREAETRLFFVAVTRAKDNLYLYYNKENPSIYIPPLKEKYGSGNLVSRKKPQMKKLEIPLLEKLDVGKPQAPNPGDLEFAEFEVDNTVIESEKIPENTKPDSDNNVDVKTAVDTDKTFTDIILNRILN